MSLSLGLGHTFVTASTSRAQWKGHYVTPEAMKELHLLFRSVLEHLLLVSSHYHLTPNCEESQVT